MLQTALETGFATSCTGAEIYVTSCTIDGLHVTSCTGHELSIAGSTGDDLSITRCTGDELSVARCTGDERSITNCTSDERSEAYTDRLKLGIESKDMRDRHIKTRNLPKTASVMQSCDSFEGGRIIAHLLLN